jgi:hypothetical protein
LVVLVISGVVVIGTVAAGLSRPRRQFAVHVIAALAAATLMNVGTDLAVTRGSLAGVACLVAAIGLLAVPLLQGRNAARSGGSHER